LPDVPACVALDANQRARHRAFDPMGGLGLPVLRVHPDLPDAE